MSQVIVNNIEAARCLKILENSDRPMTAIELAAALHLEGNRETLRRRIRAIVEELRKNGSMIIATLTEGYWLTNDKNLWADYLSGRQIDGKRIIGEASAKKKLIDRTGQGLLFEPPRERCGCATRGVI